MRVNIVTGVVRRFLTLSLSEMEEGEVTTVQVNADGRISESQSREDK